MIINTWVYLIVLELSVMQISWFRIMEILKLTYSQVLDFNINLALRFHHNSVT